MPMQTSGGHAAGFALRMLARPVCAGARVFRVRVRVTARDVRMRRRVYEENSEHFE